MAYSVVAQLSKIKLTWKIFKYPSLKIENYKTRSIFEFQLYQPIWDKLAYEHGEIKIRYHFGKHNEFEHQNHFTRFQSTSEHKNQALF